MRRDWRGRRERVWGYWEREQRAAMEWVRVEAGRVIIWWQVEEVRQRLMREGGSTKEKMVVRSSGGRWSRDMLVIYIDIELFTRLCRSGTLDI